MLFKLDIFVIFLSMWLLSVIFWSHVLLPELCHASEHWLHFVNWKIWWITWHCIYQIRRTKIVNSNKRFGPLERLVESLYLHDSQFWAFPSVNKNAVGDICFVCAFEEYKKAKIKYNWIKKTKWIISQWLLTFIANKAYAYNF